MLPRQCLAALLLLSTSVLAQEPTTSAPSVQEFRISYRARTAASANERLRGVQRAAELQPVSGTSLTHQRTLDDGALEVRASRPMTRAEAWAFAEELQKANPGVGRIEPIDPEADLVRGAAPAGAGR